MIRTTLAGSLLQKLARDNLLFAVLTSIFLYGCYSAYAYTTRPLLKSEVSMSAYAKPAPRIKRPAPPRLQKATEYLPKETWAADAKFQIAYRNSLLFFHQRKLLDDNKTLQLAPFEMVLLDQNDDSKAPVTLVCESAQLRFKDEVDLAEISSNELMGGSLRGKTRVTGPRNSAFVGRNFEFFPNANKIVSDHAVTFKVDQHTGDATGLEIRLRPPAADAPKQMLTTSGEVQSIMLRQDVRMNILTGKTSDTQPTPPDLLKIRAKGRFEYDLQTNIATFEDEVKREPTVSRFKNGKLEETLFCETLRLQFGEQIDPTADTSQKLEFERLTADGRQVLVNSIKNDLQIQMAHMVYDNIKKHTTLKSTIGPVEIRQNGRALFGQHIEIQQDEEGDIKTVRCIGPGYITDPGDAVNGGDEFTASWKQELSYGIDPQNGLQRITLFGQAVAQQMSKESTLKGDRLDVWTDPLDTDDARPTTMLASSKKSRPRIHQITATNNIIFQSPQMSGNPRKQLSIRFTPENELPAAAPKKPAANSTKEPSLLAQSPDREPVNFAADTVKIQMSAPKDSDRDPEFIEAWLTGKVTVKQPRRDLRNVSMMNGDAVHITNDSNDEQIVEISGAPARIVDSGRLIEGRKLTYERAANFARIEGEGHVQIMVDQDMEGNKLASPQPLDIHWNERMTFDGRTARFFGNVRGILTDGGLNEQKMWCDEMRVTFSRSLKYESVGGPRDKRNANVDLIEMLSDTTRPRGASDSRTVRLHSSQFGADGNTVAKRLATFQKLSYKRTAGTLTGTGPGWIKSWRPGQRKSAALSPVASASANQSAQPLTRELEFVWIDFQGDMTGNLNRRTTDFKQNTRVTYGFVKKLDQEIDPDQESLPEGSGLMFCDRLQIQHYEETDDRLPYVILVGNGNVRLEGHDYHAKADQISFDQSKDTFLLNTYGDASVLLVRQTKVGGTVTPGRAQRIKFIPSRDILEVGDATGMIGTP